MTEPPEQGSGSTVLVVTAMRLSKTARAELSELLGPGYTVVDLRSAPSTANIVLAPVSSPMAVAILRGEFPQARILFTELQDDERGISLAGPLSRIVAQAPDGYFVAHSLEALGPVVQSEARLQLAGSTGRTPLTLSLTTGLPLQAPDLHPLDETEAAGSPVQEATDTRAEATVRWIDRAKSDSTPPGQWLDLEPIDALVTHLVGTDEPRRDVLWAALTAECVVRLADDLPEDLLVDIAGLEPTIRAELQIRIASEQIPQTTWP
ncbi:hypothetical protein [Kribbella speibonae]|uniref:Uncharacterized protein n=1 Tax=Kribbella speibonae TaxID=1572660 RepID=A0A4R0IQE1_9ACTN|nr:hypothetical protein [Kribbella speibonae]TCC30875.1 hypothetical protein E0H92_37870 [Kribbella speibonae]